MEKSEIKPTVIQFTEVTGINKPEQRLGQEEYAEIIKDISALYEQTIKLYDGRIDKQEGRIFMATFGVPIAHEEDPERAIKSALLFKKKLTAYNRSNKRAIAMKAGITLGKVYAGTIGSEIKKEYTVMGDAVNTAARIMEYASPSQILVSEEIHNITKHNFQYSECSEFQARGITKKIMVYEVKFQKTIFIRRRGIDGLKSPLVGRVEIFNVLKDFLHKLLDKEKNTIVLIGDAGVGKSRLIEELLTYSLTISLEKAITINWCSGYCSPYKEITYLPFREIIKQICMINNDDGEKKTTEKLLNTINSIIGEQAEDIYPYIANLFNLKLESKNDNRIKYLEPKVLQLQTHLAFATLLRNYALLAPCVYVFDDLYLAEQTTLEAIKFFLEMNRETPMLVFLLSRPDKTNPFWFILDKIKENIAIKEINIKRLSRKETKIISENLLTNFKFPIALLDDIIEKADGNPLFLEEIIKLLIAKGIIYKKNGQWLASDLELHYEIPYTIESIIRHRFDTLSMELKTTLEEMTVIGRNFSKKILNAFCTHWEQIETLIEKIKEYDFITTNNNEDFLFNHALIREVIYNGIPEKRRQNLHLKLARTIESLFKERLPEFYELLFEHYSKTTEHNKTIEYGLKAAQTAQKRYANDEAIIYYLSVLKECNETADNKKIKYKILKELGIIHSIIGKNEQAFEFFNQSFKYCADENEKAALLTLIAALYENISEYDNAIATYNKALQTLSKDATLEKVQIAIGLARVHYEQGEFKKSLEYLKNLYDEVRDITSIEGKRTLARVYDRLGIVYYALGERQKSFENHTKALKLYEIVEDIHGMGVIYNNLCDYFTGLGDYQKALGNLRKSLEIDQTTGNLLGQAIVYYNIADTYYQLGDFEQAKQNYDKSLEIHKKINNNLGIGYNSWGLGLLAVEQDHLEKAEKYFNTALNIFSRIGSKMWQVAVMTSIAELYLVQKEYEKAIRLCNNTLTITQKINDYDAMNDIQLTIAKIKIAQAISDKKLRITHLYNARDILNNLYTHLEKSNVGLETQFDIHFQLCQVYYYLGMPQETMAFYNKSTALLNQILNFMTEDKVKEKFLARKLYRKYQQFCKKIKI